VAEKTRDALEKYNRASRRAAAAAELWRQGTGRKEPHLAAIYRSMPQAVGKLREILQQSHHNEFQPQDLLSRMDQFLAESEQIIPAASNALMREDLTEFGKQVDRSQQLTDELLGNQIPETIALARLARQHGAIAASAFGAGFGGSVWAMIESEKADSFIDRWRRSYVEAYPEPARNSSFFPTAAGPAAFELGG
jgi:galactokinase